MKIGYIYNYNETLNKGIICHGHGISRYNSNDVDIFTKDCCETIVKTGDLVYFKKENGNICNIVKASLQNFNKDFLYNLAQEFDSGVDNWKRSIENTHIYFLHDDTAERLRRKSDDDDNFGASLDSTELNSSESQDEIEYTWKALSGRLLSSMFNNYYSSIDLLDINGAPAKPCVCNMI